MLDKIELRNVWEWGYLVNKFLKNKEISTDTSQDWTVLWKYLKELESYFFVMNYQLVRDEQNGFAYIEELDEDSNHISLSKKQKMSWGLTLFLVLLREYMYRQDGEDLYSNSNNITKGQIRELLWEFLNEKFENDEKKVDKFISETINGAKKIWILSDIDGGYRINKLLKAKLNIDKLEEIRNQLK